MKINGQLFKFVEAPPPPPPLMPMHAMYCPLCPGIMRITLDLTSVKCRDCGTIMPTGFERQEAA